MSKWEADAWDEIVAEWTPLGSEMEHSSQLHMEGEPTALDLRAKAVEAGWLGGDGGGDWAVAETYEIGTHLRVIRERSSRGHEALLIFRRVE